MYCNENFKTKKALKEAIAGGKKIGVYHPNDMGFSPPVVNGKVTLEGPHYPAPHSWYAQATLQDGHIVSVK